MAQSSTYQRALPQLWKWNEYRVEGDTAYLLLHGRTGVPSWEALLDIGDLDLVLPLASWRIIVPMRDLFYASGNARGVDASARRRLYLHRVIMGITDPAVMVDHLNGDGLDCRRVNLRVTDNHGNQRNQYGHRRVRELEAENAALRGEIARLRGMLVTFRNS